MKIEFLERDDELKAVIAVINGQRKILSLSKTVEDILNMKDVPVMVHGTEEPKKFSVMETPIVQPSKEPMVVTEHAGPVEQEEPEFQREDLVKVVQYIKGISDAQGTELIPRQGVYAGGIYRIWKVNKTGVTLPEAPDKITWIINNLEVIDDKAPRPELLILMPGEFVLHQKRKKNHSVVEVKKSEFLQCQACGENNAFFLNGTKFEGKCRCGQFNSIERMIVPCDNDKCLDGAKNRNQVSLFLTSSHKDNGDRFEGHCGNCQKGIVRMREPVTA